MIENDLARNINPDQLLHHYLGTRITLSPRHLKSKQRDFCQRFHSKLSDLNLSPLSSTLVNLYYIDDSFLRLIDYCLQPRRRPNKELYAHAAGMMFEDTAYIYFQAVLAQNARRLLRLTSRSETKDLCRQYFPRMSEKKRLAPDGLIFEINPQGMSTLCAVMEYTSSGIYAKRRRKRLKYDALIQAIRNSNETNPWSVSQDCKAIVITPRREEENRRRPAEHILTHRALSDLTDLVIETTRR